ncbi:MAG: mannose-6-phosphate isomerase [Candidatus Nealsonbacteria bacterium RIFCSPLOWO2_01_FULL_43_36]|uniref:Mannose-6-phosphate isomerase n=1 Tax=Candidatus Nealsonbacteria bacterium RIFCSPHIGHO2_02_FULL_43_13 TaxID=1801668 RepID=A0A1G2E9P8_9BACT|nr:MAG: mannose-6-phosphate isomerase [Candidatus Nealsonbacteria bacterium RIFCSPHIGHO2_02_FULL_43_13]OGZ24309.1 MAG: mannose-6-phosphate isomerase [Candidatus Nealsonbacteria bacterium RIFCSPLOWO2_01_FULL_43_36]
MFIKKIKDCKELVAGDKSTLREVLHPIKDNLKIGYSLAYATVKSGEMSLLHKMKTSEVYYVLQGEGVMYIDNESKKVGSGQVVYIPPNSAQKIKNTGHQDLIFLCIVDPAWRKEDEKIV